MQICESEESRFAKNQTTSYSDRCREKTDIPGYTPTTSHDGRWDGRWNSHVRGDGPALTHSQRTHTCTRLVIACSTASTIVELSIFMAHSWLKKKKYINWYHILAINGIFDIKNLHLTWELFANRNVCERLMKAIFSTSIIPMRDNTNSQACTCVRVGSRGLQGQISDNRMAQRGSPMPLRCGLGVGVSIVGQAPPTVPAQGSRG